MFRELARAVPRQGRAGAGPLLPLAFPPSRAALLDHEDTDGGREPAAPGSGITARHVLAAETAAAALADVPPSARPVTPDRIGAIVADTPKPGVRHAGDWVRERLGLAGTVAAANGTATPGAKPVARSRRAAVDRADATDSGDGNGGSDRTGTGGVTGARNGVATGNGTATGNGRGGAEEASGTHGRTGADGSRGAEAANVRNARGDADGSGGAEAANGGPGRSGADRSGGNGTGSGIEAGVVSAGVVSAGVVSAGVASAGAASGADGPSEAGRSGRASGTHSPSGADSPDETDLATGTRGADGGPHCSLRAIVAACEALNAGEFDLVVAGGVSTGVDHGWIGGAALADSLSGDMRVYDAAPTGMVPGEGCGVVALMRAADARAAGLPVYAEIVGWHAADGDSGPSLSPAYARAGVDPADVQLLEGHGAATAAEDLAELSTLLDLLGPQARCALGAVSAIIGDTRGAAGVAALLKTALAMTAGIIPPATGCVRPHPLLAAEPAPFRLPAAAEPWPETPVQLAAVNSLGTVARPGAPRSGAVHVVLRRERDSGYRAGRRRRTAAAHGGVPAGAGPPAPRGGSGAHGAPPRSWMPDDHFLRAVPAPRPEMDIAPPHLSDQAPWAASACPVQPSGAG